MSDDKRPTALDTHGRRIDYLRLSITDLCNLRCFYCMPTGMENKLDQNEVLRLEESLEVVRAAAAIGVRKVRITGGEPLVRMGIVSLVRDVANTKGIEIVALTTNAHRLAKLAAELKEAGLDRINVSLDSLNPKVFEEITREGKVKDAIAGIDRALELGFPVKINTVMLEGINTDDLWGFIEFCRDRNISVRFIERMEFDQQEPVFSEKQAIEQLSAQHEVKAQPTSPDHPHVHRYLVDNLPVGFIAPVTHSFCEGCNKLRLTPEGQLRVCLASTDHVDLRSILRGPHTRKNLEEAILKAVGLKPKAASWNARGEMWKVGG